jgi:subtilisin-like proprotein convertase family protein
VRVLALCAGVVAPAILFAGCGVPEPRYGEATLSTSAPRVTLSGTTFGQAAALELAPGCPGYLDAEQPGHVLHVGDDVPFAVQARSEDGPLAIAIAHGDEVRCDSDEGSGHTPTLSFEGAGDYAIYVAALREPAELSYELSVRARVPGQSDAGEAVAHGSTRDVSVTITSEPPGAQVMDASGAVIGTTPSIFVANVPADQLGQDRSWTLALAGHQPVTVTGRLAEGALVLHGQLTPLGPTHLQVSAAESQPVRDYQSATLAVEVAESCTITEAEVEVDIRHSFIGDLRVIVRAPWGEEATLHRHGGGGRRNLQRAWRTSESGSPLAPFLGRSTRGRWTLVVHDDAGADQGSLDRFDLRLTCGPPGSVAAIETPITPTTIAPPDPPRPTPPTSSALPDLPTRTDIVRVLSGLRPRVEACGVGGGNVRVLASVAGSTGNVTSVSSTGTASAPERSCVERVVRSAARFPRFRRNVLDVDYTYDLPPRGGARSGGSSIPLPG